jgi:predicted metalloprotease with PDZ domain
MTDDEYDEELLDAYMAAMYHQRSRSAQEMTPEKWERIKRKFPGSVADCRRDVIRFHGDEVRRRP